MLLQSRLPKIPGFSHDSPAYSYPFQRNPEHFTRKHTPVIEKINSDPRNKWFGTDKSYGPLAWLVPSHPPDPSTPSDSLLVNPTITWICCRWLFTIPICSSHYSGNLFREYVYCFLGFKKSHIQFSWFQWFWLVDPWLKTGCGGPFFV